MKIMYKKIIFIFFFLLVLFNDFSIFGQVKKDTIPLLGITLESFPIKNKLQNTASAVSVITTTDINKTDGVILTPVLNKIPGIFMQQGALNTNRISIRGIGARIQYGTSRVKAYFDMIPLTSGDGETIIDDIDIASIKKIEITKGPNTTSFGSGLGGVIHLFSQDTPALESFGKYTTSLGSYGLMQQRLSAGYSDSNSNLYTSYSELQSDGFRANSDYKKKSFTINGNQKLSSQDNLYFLGVFNRLKAFIPSSLSEKDFNNNPEKAATTWAAAQGYESYDKFLLGLGYRHQFSENWFLNSSVFSNFKQAYEPRPFDILDENTSSLGFRLNVNYKNQLLSLPFELTFGTEMANEKYEFSLYNNLYLTQPGQGSIQGDKFSATAESRNYSNYFSQMEVWLSANLHLETGIAFNSTNYSLKDVFVINAKNQNYAFGSLWSPRVGLSYKIDNTKNIYASVSKGFSVPAVAETLTPEGQINTDLKPEIGWNYEIGFKGNWYDNKLYTEVAFFSTQIENSLVARRTADDQYVGVNAGSSSHPGLEFLLNYKLLELKNFQVGSYFSGAINHFKFKNFIDGDADYSGNKLTGVPDKQLNFGLDMNTKYGFSVNASYRLVGKMPINDSNTKYTEAYSLLDIKTAYDFKLLKNFKFQLTAGVNNALNEKYAASIVTNAVGFGNVPARPYYSGTPVSYYGGFSISYLFL